MWYKAGTSLRKSTKYQDRFNTKATNLNYERDIDEVEVFYTSLAKAYEGTGRVFFAMTDGATCYNIEERVVEKALRLTWLRLRHDPTLGVYETFTDTAAMTSWLDDTFRVVSDGISGLKCYALVMSMGTLVLFNNLFKHAEHEAHMRETLEFNASLKKEAEIASAPFNRKNIHLGKHQRVAIALSAEETIKEQGDSDRTIRYISYSLINERGHCDAPYSTFAHPASVYQFVSRKSLAVNLTVPASIKATPEACDVRQKGFRAIAQKVRDYYLDIRDNPEHVYLVPSLLGHTPAVPISNMGVLDKVIAHQHGGFELESAWVTGEELGTGLRLFLDIWKGRLSLSAAYNDAWHGWEEVVQFLERRNEITLQGLGV
ncbi:hypothetical protein BDV12DRAFT_189992 [Aspergillus spectabilis]